MNNARLFGALCSVLSVLCLCLFVSLIEERSVDIVRVTVPSNELLPTVGRLQVITGKYARAYPIDGEEDDPATRWRIVIDKESVAF